ncbi:MAG: hypothetical protein AB7N71_05870 [Phycisphaerae bacterium]
MCKLNLGMKSVWGVLALFGVVANAYALPPLPAPGDTVHWSIDLSPIVIDSSISIFSGGTVIVDPDVVVIIENQATKLTVAGRIDFQEGSSLQVADVQAKLFVSGSDAIANFSGSQENPVEISGGEYLWYTVDVQQGGSVFLNHVNCSGMIHSGTFYLQPTPPSIVVRNSHFTGGLYNGVWATFGLLVVRDSTFTGATIRTEESYLFVDNVVLDEGRIDSYRRKSGQPVYFNRITATGVTEDSPFVLEGFDHYFGPDNVISGNRWPIHLVGGGIAPGSFVPATGNAENVINVDGRSTGWTTLANVGLPYISLESGISRTRTVEPGVTVKMGPGVIWDVNAANSLILKGRPDAPIVFEPLVPGQPWTALFYNYAGSRNVLDWCEFRGAERAVHAYSSTVHVLNSIFEENAKALWATQYGRTVSRKNQFYSNAEAVAASPNGSFDANGTVDPNTFEGNAVGSTSPDSDSAIDNWWGDASGPQAPSNPGGSGDPVLGQVRFMPFRTTLPDLQDRVPSVRLMKHSSLMEVGKQVILSWRSDDDGTIMSHRIEFTPHDGCTPLTVIADDVPGDATSWVVQIPEYEASSCIDPAGFRVVAIDDAGQEGFDDLFYSVPNPDMPDGAYAPDLDIAMMRPGQEIDLCTTVEGAANTWHGGFGASLRVEGDFQGVGLGGTTTNCLSGGMQAPPVSTDLARVSTTWTYGAGNRYAVSFSNYFEIRPDPEKTGDFPPVVEMLSPADGEFFAFGGTVPIVWTATDDEAVRSFAIHASYDDGRTWHVIADDLEADQPSFDWRLPAVGPEMTGVRLRVVVRDLRFQESSDGMDRTITLVAGSSMLTGDANCDGIVSVGDVGAFVLTLTEPTTYAADFPDCDPMHADVNHDGMVSVADIGPFVSMLTTQ